MDSFGDRIKSVEESVIRLKSQLEVHKNQSETLEMELQELEKHLLIVEKAKVLITKFLDFKKVEVINKIENIVSIGLKKIFEDDSYEFLIKTKESNNSINYLFYVKSLETKEELLPIFDSRGGGLLNVVAFLLRLLILSFIAKENNQRYIFVDEPFKNLSEKYNNRVGQLLILIANKLDIQIIIISHNIVQGKSEEINDIFLEKSENSVCIRG